MIPFRKRLIQFAVSGLCLTGGALLPAKAQVELPPLPLEGLADYGMYRGVLLNEGWEPNFPNSYIPGLPELACGNRFCTALFVSSDRQREMSLIVWYRDRSEGGRDFFVSPSVRIDVCGTPDASC